MGFALTLSCMLVTAGNTSWGGTDGPRATAVTASAALWIGSLKTIPARWAVRTAPPLYSCLTLTLASNLEVWNVAGCWWSEATAQYGTKSKNTFWFNFNSYSQNDIFSHDKCNCHLSNKCVTWTHTVLLLTVPAVWHSQGWHTWTEVGSDCSSLKKLLIHSSQFLPEQEREEIDV